MRVARLRGGMEVAILSDTHVPSRAERLPAWVLDRCRAADHVLHAGDFDSPAALATVREAAGGAAKLTAVRGNTDPPSVGLPREASVDLGGVTFVLVHGDGPPYGYADRVVRTVRERVGSDAGAVGVAGHTHEHADERVDGVRLLNPGTATGASPGTETTMLVARATDGDLDVSLRRPPAGGD